MRDLPSQPLPLVRVVDHAEPRQPEGESVQRPGDSSHGLQAGRQRLAGNGGGRPVPDGAAVGTGKADLPPARWPDPRPSQGYRSAFLARFRGQYRGDQLQRSIEYREAGRAELPAIAVSKGEPMWRLIRHSLCSLFVLCIGLSADAGTV